MKISSLTGKILLTILLILFYQPAFAIVQCKIRGGGSNHAVTKVSSITIPTQTINYTGAANTLPVGYTTTIWQTTLTVNGAFKCDRLSGYPTQFNSTSNETWKANLWVATNSTPINGMTYSANGLTYPIFSTTVPGIGYIFSVTAENGNIITPSSSASVQNYYYSDNINIKLTFQFIITGPLKSGNYIIPPQTIANYQLRNLDDTIDSTNIIPVISNASTINISATTCTVNTSNINVSLPVVYT